MGVNLLSDSHGVVDVGVALEKPLHYADNGILLFLTSLLSQLLVSKLLWAPFILLGDAVGKDQANAKDCSQVPQHRLVALPVSNDLELVLRRQVTLAPQAPPGDALPRLKAVAFDLRLLLPQVLSRASV